ncbi:MAG: 2-oxo acid dehydrogenase subunit E2 [Treponemataceae bacterium]|nr:2-oxo acid dehydrogenase subunit E2 [Treponemataceae bacterium]
MAHVVVMPKQGNTVESCIIVAWHVKEGDMVQPETPLCDVETDKATFEVPAGVGGRVLKLLYPVGEDIPVLQPIAVIGEAGEDWETALGQKGDRGDSRVAHPEGEKEKKQDQGPLSSREASPEQARGLVSIGISSPQEESLSPHPEDYRASPRARKRAEKEAVPLHLLSGSGPEGRIIERDVVSYLERRPPLTAAARAALRESKKEGDPHAGYEKVSPGESQEFVFVPTEGTGIGGRIRENDLTSFVATPHAENPQTFATEVTQKGNAVGSLSAGEKAEPRTGLGGTTVTPIRGIRKVIAERMWQSLATTAQFTLHSHGSAQKILGLRQKFKESTEELGLRNITLNDMILFLVSRLLPRYSYLNAHKVDEQLITYQDVHLGMAVDTPRGLMVPVIRHAHRCSLAEISRQAKRLAQACLEGTISPDDLSGSTFTVTNLGALGVEAFTPVLNVPEVAILGVCSIESRPVQGPGGNIVLEPHIGFSLTINHQVVDGAPAARFLHALVQAVEQFDLWMAL